MFSSCGDFDRINVCSIAHNMRFKLVCISALDHFSQLLGCGQAGGLWSEGEARTGMGGDTSSPAMLRHLTDTFQSN